MHITLDHHEGSSWYTTNLTSAKALFEAATRLQLDMLKEHIRPTPNSIYIPGYCGPMEATTQETLDTMAQAMAQALQNQKTLAGTIDVLLFGSAPGTLTFEDLLPIDPPSAYGPQYYFTPPMVTPTPITRPENQRLPFYNHHVPFMAPYPIPPHFSGVPSYNNPPYPSYGYGFLSMVQPPVMPTFSSYNLPWVPATTQLPLQPTRETAPSKQPSVLKKSTRKRPDTCLPEAAAAPTTAPIERQAPNEPSIKPIKQRKLSVASMSAAKPTKPPAGVICEEKHVNYLRKDGGYQYLSLKQKAISPDLHILQHTDEIWDYVATHPDLPTEQANMLLNICADGYDELSTYHESQGHPKLVTLFDKSKNDALTEADKLDEEVTPAQANLLNLKPITTSEWVADCALMEPSFELYEIKTIEQVAYLRGEGRWNFIDACTPGKGEIVDYLKRIHEDAADETKLRQHYTALLDTCEEKELDELSDFFAKEAREAGIRLQNDAHRPSSNPSSLFFRRAGKAGVAKIGELEQAMMLYLPPPRC